MTGYTVTFTAFGKPGRLDFEPGEADSAADAALKAGAALSGVLGLNGHDSKQLWEHIALEGVEETT